MLLKRSPTQTQSACHKAGGTVSILLETPSWATVLCFPLSDKMTTPDNISKANITFALSVLKKLADANPAADVFFSPFSISAALAMVMLGTRGNTAAQMSEVQQVAHGDVKRATFSSSYNKKKLQQGGGEQLETGRSDSSCYLKSCHFSLAEVKAKGVVCGFCSAICTGSPR